MFRNRPWMLLAIIATVVLLLPACTLFDDDDEDEATPTSIPEAEATETVPASPEGDATPEMTGSPAAEGTPETTGSPAIDGTEPGTGSPEADGTVTTTVSPAAQQTATAPPDETPGADLIGQGGQIFANVCAACHQPDGQGVEGAYPALADNPLVTADNPDPVIEVILTGRGGMPRFGGTYSNEEIAGIISYIRQAWDNEAEPISPDQVQEVRQSLEDAGEGESDEGTSGQEESGDD